MKTLFPDFQTLIKHFHGNKRLAVISFSLFIVGITVFIVNNTVLFFIKDDRTYFYPRLCMRFIVSAAWLLSAIIGTLWNRTKRNQFLLPSLFLYMIADVVVFFSIPVSALFYGLGHVFLLFAIQQSTWFHKYQFALFFLLVPTMVIALIIFLDGFSLIVLIASVYGMLCIAMMAASLSNRFYRVGGVVFLVSDLAGLARVELLNDHATYVITTIIYYLAIFLYSASVYNESRKEVVTSGDVIKLVKSAKKTGLQFWLSGQWGIGLIRNDKKYAHRNLELIYDVRETKEFEHWLKECGYSQKTQENHYYSEKYGELKALPCKIHSDGSAWLQLSKEKGFDLDKDFFSEIYVKGIPVKCLLPEIHEKICYIKSSENL